MTSIPNIEHILVTILVSWVVAVLILAAVYAIHSVPQLLQFWKRGAPQPYDFQVPFPTPPRKIRPKFLLVIQFLLFICSLPVLSFLIPMLVVLVLKVTGGITMPLSLIVLVAMFVLSVLFLRIRLLQHVRLVRNGKFEWADMVSLTATVNLDQLLGGAMPNLALGQLIYVYKFSVNNQWYANTVIAAGSPYEVPPDKMLILYDPTNPALNWPYENLAFKVCDFTVPSLITPDYQFYFQSVAQDTYVEEHLRRFDVVKKVKS